MTASGTLSIIRSSSFNPHTREGVTSLGRILILLLYMLQSTHPRGCDLRYIIHIGACYGFNPHTREGVTVNETEAYAEAEASIHTPARV